MPSYAKPVRQLLVARTPANWFWPLDRKRGFTNPRFNPTIPQNSMAGIRNLIYGQAGAVPLMLVLLCGFGVMRLLQLKWHAPWTYRK